MSTWDGLPSQLRPPNESTSAGGVLTLADLEAMFQSMYDHETAHPDYFLVSPKNARRIWRAVQRSALYRRYPLPKRRLRKIAMRKRQSLIERGRRRVARDEREIYDRVLLPPYEG